MLPAINMGLGQNNMINAIRITKRLDYFRYGGWVRARASYMFVCCLVANLSFLILFYMYNLQANHGPLK